VPPVRPKLWRWLLRWMTFLCLILIVAVGVGVGWPVYVRPQIDQLRHADAILILGGYGSGRYSVGMDLGRRGWAPIVVVSNPDHQPSLSKSCAKAYPHLTVECITPDPPTTKGEGRELRSLAAKYGWRTVIVVTFRPHISRARFELEQCFDGDLVMVPSPAHLSVVRWAYEYVYQTAGYVRAALQPGC
jgi:hypothetical protein